MPAFHVVNRADLVSVRTRCSATATLLWVLLGTYTNGRTTGSWDVSKSELSRMLGVSARVVQRAIGELETCGYVAVMEREYTDPRTGRKMQGANGYALASGETPTSPGGRRKRLPGGDGNVSRGETPASYIGGRPTEDVQWSPLAPVASSSSSSVLEPRGGGELHAWASDWLSEVNSNGPVADIDAAKLQTAWRALSDDDRTRRVSRAWLEILEHERNLDLPEDPARPMDVDQAREWAIDAYRAELRAAPRPLEVDEATITAAHRKAAGLGLVVDRGQRGRAAVARALRDAIAPANK